MNGKDTTRGKPARPGNTPAASDSGRQAEELAAVFLAQQGLHLLKRNHRCRGGEIDLICRDGQVIVFVEVRLRRNSAYGGAAASITARKQARIILAARHYLALQQGSNAYCRFDCILLDALSAQHIEWIRDAFSAV